MEYDIITIGSATIDNFIYTDAQLIKIESPHLEKKLLAYQLGSKILIKNMKEFTGGGGTNTAIGFSKMGLKTAFIGKLGNDLGSRKIISELNLNKITFLGKVAKEGQTGYSVVLDSFAHDRTILTFKGENNNLLIKDLANLDFKTKYLYISSVLEKTFDTAIKIAKKVKKQKGIVIFNPSLYQTKLGLEKLKSIFKYVDILIFNKEEAQTLINTKENNMIFLLENIKRIGFSEVVITDGNNGAYAVDYLNNTYHAKTHNIKVIESTGAGDSFSVGFVSGLFYGLDFEDALKLGVINSESILKYPGAKNQLLTFKEAKKKLDKDK